MGKRKTTEQFKEEMFVINPNIEVIEEYINSTTKILVKDKSCNHEWKSIPLNLLCGHGCPECALLNKFKDRTGETNYNKVNEKMEIINYINQNDINVKFEDGIIVKHKTYNSFKLGTIINPYHKFVFNIGYLGEGKYHVDYSKLKYNKQFMTWKSMLTRCYNENQKLKTPTYKYCVADKSWHNFQNFATWYEKNYYEINNEIMALDKDILCKGNKIYSPETCVFVPQKINSLFTKCDKARGKYPIGVYFDDDNGKFISTCRNTLLNNKVYLGSYSDQNEAFQRYKVYKEKHIKEVADYYKDKIPKKLYDSMYRYEVDIDD